MPLQADLILQRFTEDTFQEAPGVIGRRCRFITKTGRQLEGVERGGGYMRIKPASDLRAPSLYVIRMELFRGGRALRVIGVPRVRIVNSRPRTEYTDRTLVHVANKASQLAGCAAPGMVRTPYGVADSSVAMQTILNDLGGWDEGAEFRMQVFEVG